MASSEGFAQVRRKQEPWTYDFSQLKLVSSASRNEHLTSLAVILIFNETKFPYNMVPKT